VLGGQYGKTCYVLRFVEDTYNDSDSPTVEYSFYKTLQFESEEAHIELLDTSGDIDAYSNLHEKWILTSQGIIVLCNLNVKASLQEAAFFLKTVVTTWNLVWIPKIIVATGGSVCSLIY
jgi:GTPase SAR1 family protein